MKGAKINTVVGIIDSQSIGRGKKGLIRGNKLVMIWFSVDKIHVLRNRKT